MIDTQTEKYLTRSSYRINRLISESQEKFFFSENLSTRDFSFISQSSNKSVKNTPRKFDSLINLYSESYYLLSFRNQIIYVVKLYYFAHYFPITESISSPGIAGKSFFFFRIIFTHERL